MSNLATITNNILADSGIDDINVIVSTGSYANPAWITSLAWTKITGTPTTLAGYGITDAVTLGTNQIITGEKLFSGLALQIASAGTASPTIIRNTSGTTGSTGGYNTIGFNSNNNIFVDTTNSGGFILDFSNTVSNRVYTLQNASGTLAFTSQIPANPIGGTGTSGQVAYFNGTTTITSESNLFWNATNDRLGIGTSSPSEDLTINKPSAASVFIGLKSNSSANQAYVGMDSGGLFQLQTNNGISFYTGASFSRQVDIFTTGNVGINVAGSDSGFKLDVNGTGRFSGNVGIGTTATSTDTLSIANTNARNELQFTGSEFTNIYSQTTSGIQFGITSSGNSAGIDFLTNNSIKVSITSGGNVGIGTSSPTNRLHVVSADNEGIFMQGTNNGGHWFNFRSANSNLWSMGAQPGLMGWYNRTDATYKMVITDSGNVGIGTTSPGQRLVVENSTDTFLQLRNSAAGQNFFIGALNGEARLNNDNSTPITMWVNGSERMRITSAGNVGIGTASPTQKLHVNNGSSSVYIQLTGQSKNLYLGQDGTGAAIVSEGDAPMYFSTGTSATERMRITSGGNLLVGTTTDIGAKLYVDGAFRTGTLTAGTQTAAVDWRLGNARGGTATANALVRVQINGVLVDLIGNYV